MKQQANEMIQTDLVIRKTTSYFRRMERAFQHMADENFLPVSNEFYPAALKKIREKINASRRLHAEVREMRRFVV